MSAHCRSESDILSGCQVLIIVNAGFLKYRKCLCTLKLYNYKHLYTLLTEYRLHSYYTF